MLKIIVNNTNPAYGSSLPKGLEAKQTPIVSPALNSFLVDFQEFSQNLFVLRVKDLEHHLACEMTLELKEGFPISAENIEDEYIVPILTGNFPSIDVSRFNEKVCWEDYLQGILMFQFQLKILEQLFIFCEEKGVVNLILTFSEHDLDYLEIYKRFFVFEEQITTARGEQTRIVIPTDVQTYDEILDFMDDVDTDLRQTLWQNQKGNPAFRKYLLNHALQVR